MHIYIYIYIYVYIYIYIYVPYLGFKRGKSAVIDNPKVFKSTFMVECRVSLLGTIM